MNKTRKKKKEKEKEKEEKKRIVNWEFAIMSIMNERNNIAIHFCGDSICVNCCLYFFFFFFFFFFPNLMRKIEMIFSKAGCKFKNCVLSKMRALFSMIFQIRNNENERGGMKLHARGLRRTCKFRCQFPTK